MFLLLPLLGLAAVSGATLSASSSASADLNRAQLELTQLNAADEEIQIVLVKGITILASHQTDDVISMVSHQKTVDMDLAGLALLSSGVGVQSGALRATQLAWESTAPIRASVVAASPQTVQVAAAALEDELSSSITGVIDRLNTLEDMEVANVALLHQRLDTAFLQSMIAIVVSLLFGLAGALFISRRLALSILRPLVLLRDASEHVAAGKLDHRVNVAGNDELAELGTAFNTMADQLGERQEEVRRREQRLSALVENATDGILVIAADGGLSFATPSFAADFADEGIQGTFLFRDRPP